jgi:hypothetical protein
MNLVVRIPLQVSTEQHGRLQSLQSTFAEACNALAVVVRDTRCWNRVALHHMTYKAMRERFPDLGSQMVCNAVYSVSRASRLVYQHPSSPFNLSALGGRALPLLRFAASCPVYFDRHTLSLKGSKLSMYTLDGRMHFELALLPEDQRAFHERKLREIVLSSQANDIFLLTFRFEASDANTSQVDEAAALEMGDVDNKIPDYLSVDAEL